MPDAPDESARIESPGALLRDARLEAGLEPAEVAERLNWLPRYVSIIEQDDYGELRNPSFAQGYVRAYGKLLGVNELRLRHAFEEWEQDREDARGRRRVARQPLHLQRTGKGVVVGLATLGLLVAVLWWQNGSEPVTHSAPAMDTTGESATQMSVGE